MVWRRITDRAEALVNALRPRSWVRFRYCEFYDVPRYIVLRYNNRCFFLESPFDDAADDYSPDYVVYLFPESVLEVPQTFGFLDDRNLLTCIGRLPVKDVQFDSSVRKALDASALDRFSSGRQVLAERLSNPDNS